VLGLNKFFLKNEKFKKVIIFLKSKNFRKLLILKKLKFLKYLTKFLLKNKIFKNKKFKKIKNLKK